MEEVSSTVARAMSQNNTSSSETHMSFAAAALPSSTQGSGDSGGGGTTSWVAVSTSSHSGASAGNGQTTPRGRTQRSSLARAVRHPSRRVLPRGVVALVIRPVLRNANLQVARLGVRVNFDSNLSISVMRWIRVRKLGWN